MDDSSSSTGQLFHDAANEILQIVDVLVGFEKHKVNLASMRGMRTVFEILHSALYELKTKQKIKDGGQEIPVCTEKTSVDIEEDDLIQQHIKVEKTDASSHASEKEETSETTPLVSLMDVLNMFFEAGSLALDAALELFWKFLCCVRLTLEMVLDEIIWREDLGSQQKTMPEHQGKQEPTDTLGDEVPLSAINHLLGLLSFGSLTKFDLERLILNSLKECVDYGVSGSERSFKIVINKIGQDISKILQAPPDKEFKKENEQTSPDKEFKEEIVHTSTDKKINKELGQASPDKEFDKIMVHASPDKEFNEKGQTSPEEI